MLCSSCSVDRPTVNTELDLIEHGIHEDISRIDCQTCKTFIALKANDEIIRVDDTYVENIENCWSEAKTTKEKIMYYMLSQIVYPEFDPPNADKFESLYDFPDDFDVVMLRWENGKVIGFYTVKPKGSKIYSSMETYSITTLDTAYIRSQHRNRGLGLEILSDIVKRFPDQDIGFSHPISEGMWGVLRKFLKERKEYRPLFWETESRGYAGSQKLIWFLLKKKFPN